jgi:hypothetical protein
MNRLISDLMRHASNPVRAQSFLQWKANQDPMMFKHVLLNIPIKKQP